MTLCGGMACRKTTLGNVFLPSNHHSSWRGTGALTRTARQGTVVGHTGTNPDGRKDRKVVDKIL